MGTGLKNFNLMEMDHTEISFQRTNLVMVMLVSMNLNFVYII